MLRAQRVAVAARALRAPVFGITDAGSVPSSQPVELTLRLAMSAERRAALDQLLADQMTSSSASYHKWLTPQEFATQFGATDDQIEATTAWLESQGLMVKAVSPAKTRLTVTGNAGQVQSAFAVTLHQYQDQTVNARYVANTTQPSIPQSMAQLVSGVSGLNDIPPVVPATLSGFTSAGPLAPPAVVSQSADTLAAAAAVVDTNNASILTFTTNACSSDFTQADYDAYGDLFRQANAQGITVLATSGCGARGTGSFPASLPQVTALVVDPATSSFEAIAPRPDWQIASGLPSDESRVEPDLTTSSASAFTQALTTILSKAGTREGNINSRLYSLATQPDLYTQPDNQPAGTWESSTGLGVVDLATLIKVFPRDTGSFTTTTSLQSSSYAMNYGAAFTLTAKVLAPVYTNASPSGTVTFTSTTQGILGSASIDSTGTATLNLNTGLNVGTYNVTANYLGDANYAASSNTTAVIITISPANAGLMATISPATNVPYGATATVTATVTLQGSSVAPTGTVTAQVVGVTGASYSASLSPNPGGNSATTNINVVVPSPGTTYNIQVTCAGNQNFQCQTPVNIPFTTVKGNTLTAVTVASTTPQAGQPVTLTAAVSNAGNATGNFVFTGNITFYDNGKIVATSPVGGNQATASVAFSGNVTHSVVAAYSGDANWNPSSSSVQAVNAVLLPSTVTLTSNVTGIGTTLAGVNVTFTATVFSTTAGTAGPTGTVTLYDTYNGSVVTLGAPALTPNGPNQSIATLSTTGLLGGTHSVYAVYSGDPDYNSATSAPLSVTLGDYNLTMNPQSTTIGRGQSGQVAIQLDMLDGFSGTVSFSCAAPGGTEISCSFSPASLTGGGSTTMTIGTTSPAQSGSAQLRWKAAAGASLAMLFCFAAPRRRRFLPKLVLLFCALCLTANFGCGNDLTTSSSSSGSSGSSSSDSGTPLGTQILTITAAGTEGGNTVRHTYQYQVTVQ